MIRGPDHRLIIAGQSNVVCNQVAANSLTILHQPVSGAYLRVTVSGGTANSGTITINSSEVITFTVAAIKMSTQAYSSLSTLASANLADETTKPTILIESVTQMGEPLGWTDYTFYDCNFYRVGQNASVQQYTKGLSATNIYKVKIEGDVPISLSDEFYVDGVAGLWKVQSEPDKVFQLGTDLVDYTEFNAVMIANTPAATAIETYI